MREKVQKRLMKRYGFDARKSKTKRLMKRYGFDARKSPKASHEKIRVRCKKKSKSVSWNDTGSMREKVRQSVSKALQVMTCGHLINQNTSCPLNFRLKVCCLKYFTFLLLRKHTHKTEHFITFVYIPPKENLLIPW